MKKLIVLILFFMAIMGCQKNKKLTIKPMLTRINKEIEHGVQFFEIDNYSEYPYGNLIDSIVAYSERELSKNNQMPPKVTTQYFYKETFFGGCSDDLIDLDSDFYEEGIPKRMDQRVALIWLFPSNDKKNDSIFNREITYWTDKGYYEENGKIKTDSTRYQDIFQRIYYTRRDSILIKGITWNTLKKGIIKRN